MEKEKLLKEELYYRNLVQTFPNSDCEEFEKIAFHWLYLKKQIEQMK